MPTPFSRRSASIFATIPKRSRSGRRPAPTSKASGCISRAACAASLVQKTAPREFTQHARNPARSVVIGGQNTVFAPAYGSPFVRNLDEGRRYARIEDFRNFVKLAYMSNFVAPFGRHHLRAGRSAGEQAPSRHGVQPSEVQRQGVHGIGHRARARGRFGGAGEHRVRRRNSTIRPPAGPKPPSSI